MKIIKTLLILLMFSAGIFAASDFENANKLYEAGKYTEAVTDYNKIILEGNKSAEVFFNIGNAYFKDKKTGFAILNYEKALMIAPRDADIKYNLDFARSFIKENAVQDSAARILNLFYYFLTINEICVILSVSFMLMMTLLIMRIFKKNELSYWLNFSFSILFIIMSVLAFMRIYENENTKSAIVIAASVEAKSAPIESNPSSFTIPEGKKVFLLNTREDWVEVLLKSENIKGWIKKETISNIELQ